MKKPKNRLDYLRLGIQLFFLVTAPAAFSTAFLGLKSSAEKLGQNGLPAMTGMLKLCIALFLFTFLFGRFFCGWACAFGTYTDIVNRIGRGLHIKQIKLEKLDKWGPKIKYFVLVLILGICFAGLKGLMAGTSPWDVFAKAIGLHFDFSGYTVGVILLLLFTVGALFIERCFCRFFCPMGAVFSLIAYFSLKRVKKQKNDCGKCKACTSVCPAKINLNQTEEVKSGECFQCSKCVEICPRKNSAMTILGRPVNQLAAILIQTAILFALLYYFNAVRFTL